MSPSPSGTSSRTRCARSALEADGRFARPGRGADVVGGALPVLGTHDRFDRASLGLAMVPGDRPALPAQVVAPGRSNRPRVGDPEAALERVGLVRGSVP